MSAIRNNVQDFMSAIRSQGKNANSTSPNLYAASINADGFSVQVLKNGAVLYNKIVYNQGCPSIGPQGDGNQDSMTIYAAEGSIATGSVTNFLSTLT
jgi:hypothetical protein